MSCEKFLRVGLETNLIIMKYCRVSLVSKPIIMCRLSRPCILFLHMQGAHSILKNYSMFYEIFMKIFLGSKRTSWHTWKSRIPRSTRFCWSYWYERWNRTSRWSGTTWSKWRTRNSWFARTECKILVYSKSLNSVHFCPKNTSHYLKLRYFRVQAKNCAIERNRTNFTIKSNTFGPKS